MVLMLKFIWTLGIRVDLLNQYGFEPFRILLGSKLSHARSLRIRWFATAESRCKHQNLRCFFGKKVRVSRTSTGKASNPHELASNQCLLLFTKWKRWVSLIITWFCSEICFESLKCFDLMLFSMILGLNSEIELVIFLLLPFNRFGFFSFFTLFFSTSHALWSHKICRCQWWTWCLNCSVKIQWWWFCFESLRINETPIEIAPILILEP